LAVRRPLDTGAVQPAHLCADAAAGEVEEAQVGEPGAKRQDALAGQLISGEVQLAQAGVDSERSSEVPRSSGAASLSGKTWNNNI
jgi:hypothetical protein